MQKQLNSYQRNEVPDESLDRPGNRDLNISTLHLNKKAG
jgi:hypothetical protein